MEKLGTQLNDRFLWFDGHCTLEPDGLADLILKGNKLDARFHVSDVTKEVKAFNRLSDFELTVKEELGPVPNNLSLPKPYQTLDVQEYVRAKLEHRAGKLSEDELALRRSRVEDEIVTFDEFGLDPLLRLLIYIVETFREKNIVWGVGRGSSCASYILYLIGIHDVDSVEFELDINDFLR